MQLVLGMVITFLFSGCKEQQLGISQNISVSQGTYLGVVHLSWDPVPDAQSYNIDRQDPLTNEWTNAGTVNTPPFDDYGFNLPDNKIVPGDHYFYRLSAGSADISDGNYVNADKEGWVYEQQKPVITDATIQANGSVIITWNDPNSLNNLVNFTGVTYEVYRKDIAGNYTKIGSTDGEKTFTDNNPPQDPVYKVEAQYNYTFKNMSYGIYSGTVIAEGEDYTATGGGQGTIDYVWNALGNVVTSTEAVSFVEIKEYGTVQYLGVITGADAAGHGKPAVFKLNGTSWGTVGGSYPVDIMDATSLDKMDFSMEGQNLWLAGLDNDSLYVFTYDGSTWSGNRTSKNLGAGDSPSSLAMDVSGNILFLAITEAPDYNLKVLKWNGSGWETVGGDANGYLTIGKDVFSLGLKNIDGTLYLSYLTRNSDYNSTFHIRHLNGTSWGSDLDWTADNIMGLHLAKNGSSPLYFTGRSQKPAEWPGGVFKVTSSTTAEDLISSSDSWFLDPFNLTVDTDGNVFIVSTKFISASEIYPAVFTYNGNTWSNFSGDFSGGITPVAINTDGTDIFYIYGDGNNLTPAYQPKALKSVKFSK